VIVEDSGASSTSRPHLDMWVDGRTGTRSAVDRCMDRITAVVTALRSPGPGYPVIIGAVYSRGACRV
jgi:hypothetical protein